MSYAAVIGTFDGLHRGHMALLQRLRHEALRTNEKTMVVTFSHHPLALLRPDAMPKLLDDNTNRLKRLENEVDKVLVLSFNPELQQKTASEFMAMLAREGVSTLLMGYDTRFGSDMPRDIESYRKAGAEVGVRIIILDNAVRDAETVIASSAIREAIGKGDISTANKLTGRPYHLSGTVVSGRHQGRTIGFPTANIEVPAERMIPASGVYAAKAILADGSQHPAMVNIGNCPTFTDGTKQTIEAHLTDFSGDIYGQSITLLFVARIRSEKRFGSADELVAQLKCDREAILRALAAHQ